MACKYHLTICSESKAKKSEISNHNWSHFNLIIDLNRKIVMPLPCIMSEIRTKTNTSKPLIMLKNLGFDLFRMT